LRQQRACSGSLEMSGSGPIELSGSKDGMDFYEQHAI
jgi:hypothetical protein